MNKVDKETKLDKQTQQKNAKWLFENLSMSKFINRQRMLPNKRKASERKNDFNEVYESFSQQLACEQAARCSQCGIPYCQTFCPLHNNIPDWLMLAASGRWYEAYQHSSATNPFPEICGRICPQDRLCEGNCVIEQSNHGAVTIGSVESYITDLAWKNGWIRQIPRVTETGKSVGIIGSGPAGLAAAIELRTVGIKVEIWEKNDRPGGLLTYGIPNFKLDRKVVEKRIKFLKDMGVIFTLNCQIGVDISFAECRKKHDAILITTGVYKNRRSGCTWPSKSGTIPALPYLIASNRLNYGDTLSKQDKLDYQIKGKTVLVIGGGDTAMDCIRTAIRQDAKEVICIYRRDRNNMPGSKRELLHAEEEGAKFAWKLSPVKYLQTSEGILKSLEVQPMIITRSSMDSNRKNIIISEQEPFEIKCDTAIEALGFTPENLNEIFDANDLLCDLNGQVIVNKDDSQTNIASVFAAGDIVRGASLVVWAIRDGTKAGTDICSFLLNKQKQAA